VIEYGLLLAVLALALVGVLTTLRNSVGGVANRTSTRVAQSAGGYRNPGKAPTDNPVAQSPAAPDPDSSSASEDGSPEEGGATAAVRFTKR
jgi:Flp pilus assembly pilin Flp